MAQLTLVIGNKNYSSWSLRPWIFMRYFDIPFDEERIALFVETTAQLLEPYFSNHKVPVLQDGSLNVWDSLAIMEHLSERYLDNRGWPTDNSARAVARAVSAEMHSSFASLRNALPMNCRKTFPGFVLSPDVRRDIERITQLWRFCRCRYGQDGEWLFGEFSIADAMFAPVVLRFVGYDVVLEEVETDYVQSVVRLPAMKEWIDAGRAEKEVIEMDEIEP